jgi:hypothetical protein
MHELKNRLCGIPSVAPETNVAGHARNSTIVGSAFTQPAAVDRKRNASPQRAGKKVERPETGINRESAIPDFVEVGFMNTDGTDAGSLVIEVDKRVEPRPELTRADPSKDGGLPELKPDPAPPTDLSVWEKLEKAFNTRTEPNQ